MNARRGVRRVGTLLASAACLALTACGPSGAPPAEPRPPAPSSATDPHAQAQVAMEKASMEFGHVVVVRLRTDGKRLEVASIMPTVVAQTQMAGQSAKTIFRVNDARDGLVLFSRDLRNGSSFRTEMKFPDLEARKGFAFPVVQADGSLREKQYTLEKIVSVN